MTTTTTTTCAVRLRLEGAYNIRELGGYPTVQGRFTQWHRFLRGDDLSQLTDDDVRMLIDYGVTSVLDLRSDDEARKRHDVFAPTPGLGASASRGVIYRRIPFISGNVNDATRDLLAVQPTLTMGDFYKQLVLREQPTVASLLECLAEMPEGCVLFHCAAGKDRTGVLAMLLMMIAGVEPVDIMVNYQMTYQYMLHTEVGASMIRQMPAQIPETMLRSEPDTIKQAIDAIIEGYGNIDAYLSHCGVDADAVAAIRSKLLD